MKYTQKKGTYSYATWPGIHVIIHTRLDDRMHVDGARPNEYTVADVNTAERK
jgi:hypothetical protein